MNLNLDLEKSILKEMEKAGSRWKRSSVNECLIEGVILSSIRSYRRGLCTAGDINCIISTLAYEFPIFDKEGE